MAVQTAEAAWKFSEVAAQAGIQFSLVSGDLGKKFLIETMGGGICVIDSDLDNWPDLFFVNGNSLDPWRHHKGPSNRLYRNNHDGTFADRTRQAGLKEHGWGMGCAAADFDNDGDGDLYVANFGANAFYRNNGDGTFTEIARAAGVLVGGWSTGAAFGDYDGDGDLDLYVASYVDFDFEHPGGDPRFCSYRGVTVACGPRGLPAAQDTLFRNDGKGRFTDVSVSSGVDKAERSYGFQPIWSDLDEDGDLDIFVANDSVPNFLWRNNGDGTFTEMALLMGLAYNQEGRAQSNMGVDIGDFDGDGNPDLYSTNFSDDYNVLYQNSGKSYFQDVTFSSRIAQNTFRFLGFGTLFADFDNDGRPDLFSANGHIYPEVQKYGLGSDYAQPNQLFRNLGNKQFEDIGSKLGPGLAVVKSSRGAVLLDWDRDGDLDIAVSNMDARVDLLRNDLSPRSNYLQVELRGRFSNRDGIGARVVLITDSNRQTQELHAGSSFLGSCQKLLHFGLGDSQRVDRLVIKWPSGKVQTLREVKANQHILVDEERGLAGLSR